ncbi:hypothetical protein C8J57DRAFT_63593 [Mycena rebaudengoi]|nr:hypothetical protein C8J57DRAFT_63593 [Mycena rebaudengoi]
MRGLTEEDCVTATDDLCDPGRAADVGDDDEMGLESVSDPAPEEAVDADDREGSVRFFDEGSSSASHGVSSRASHMYLSRQYRSNSNSTTSGARTRSQEADTEEDAVAPITPLPTTTHFDLNGGRRPRTARGRRAREEEDGFVDVDAGGRMTSRTTGSTRCLRRRWLRLRGKGNEGKEKKEKRSKTKKRAEQWRGVLATDD